MKNSNYFLSSIFFCFFTLSSINEQRPLLGLVMIVKNEAHWVAKGLATIKNHIDYWCILDTGSTDGTQELIKKTLAGIPGELHEEPFIDFAASRNRVLDLAGEKTVFVLTLNGDDFVHNGTVLRNFCIKEQHGKEGAYMILRTDPSHTCDFYSRRLIRTSSKPRFVGRTHEYLNNLSQVKVHDVSILCDPPADDLNRKHHAWQRDLTILMHDFQHNPKNSRTVFYLAQTYQCLGRMEEAFEWYTLRASMGGFYEEVYESHCRKAQIAQELNRPFKDVLELYREAHNISPHRAEPLFHIARIYREKDMFALAFIYIRYACELPYPESDGLFVQKHIYDFERWNLMAITGCYVNQFALGLQAAQRALACYPDNEHLKNNLKYYLTKNSTLS